MTKNTLLRLSKIVAKKANETLGKITDKDWKWKVIGVPVNQGNFYYFLGMASIKRNFWGTTLGNFHDRLTVCHMYTI